MVAAAKLDGSGKRVLKTQKKHARPSLEGIYPHSAGLVIEIEELNTEYNPVRRFLVQSQHGDKKFGADNLPLMTFSDISLDGKLVTGTGSVTKHIDGELYVESSVKIYDLANDQTVGLDRKTLLGLATTPVVTPPRTNPLPVPATTKAEPPAAAKAHFDEGQRQYRYGTYAGGRAAFSKAIELYPDYVEAYATRAVLYKLDGLYKEALVDLNTVIRLSPNDIHGYIKRGQYYYKVGDHKAARADFDAAIRVNPRSHEAYYERAFFFSLIGDKQKEAEDRKTASELPDEPVR